MGAASRPVAVSVTDDLSTRTRAGDARRADLPRVHNLARASVSPLTTAAEDWPSRTDPNRQTHAARTCGRLPLRSSRRCQWIGPVSETEFALRDARVRKLPAIRHCKPHLRTR